MALAPETLTVRTYGEQALLIFLWKIYAGPSDIGSVDRMYDNLVCAADRSPVPDNKDGQFLTMNSRDGLMFGVINTVGNFGTVFVDQSYWQGAIACKPSATYRGYLLGGMAWFAIPFSMATALGLAGRALDLPIVGSESGSGLVPPAVAVHLMGTGGAFLVAFQLFLAITSTANSEQLAVASLFSYDIYKRYLNPNASGAQMIFVSRVAVCFWGVFSGVIATILFELGIGLGWVYGAMGNFIGSAVLPIAFALTWSQCSAYGAMAGAWVGQISAMVAWLCRAYIEEIANPSCSGISTDDIKKCQTDNPWSEGAGKYQLGDCLQQKVSDLKDDCDMNPTKSGFINVDSLGDIDALLSGNLAAILVSGVVCVAVSLASPQNYNWDDLRAQTDSFLVEDDKHAHLAASGEESKEAMDKAYWYTTVGAAVMSIVLVVLWPALALPADPFSKSYFTWWVTIAFIWGHFAFVVTVLLPIYEFIFPAKEEEQPQEAAAPPKEMAPAPLAPAPVSEPEVMVPAQIGTA